MTVAELLKELEGVDPNTIVVMSSDEEGNRFYHLSEVALSQWDGANDETVHPDDVAEYEEGELVQAICLWP